MPHVLDVVRRLAPRAKPAYLAAFAAGGDLLRRHEITTPSRVAHFLAQVMHESGALTIEWENMNYRAERLFEIFGPHNHSARVTREEAARLAGRSQAIAERVYGLGNPIKAAELGNVDPGDGYRYRGGGLLQTTGRANYRLMGEKTGVDFENDPDLVVSAEHALKPALAEWTGQRLNSFADEDDVLSISRAINLGNTRTGRTPIGMADRRVWLDRAKRAVGDEVTLEVRGGAVDPPGPRIGVMEIKRRLQERGLWAGALTEDFDAPAKEAVTAWLLNQGVRRLEEWNDLRLIIGAGQALCRADGIDPGPIDGYMGPQTRDGFERYLGRPLTAADIADWRDGMDAEDEPVGAPAVVAANPAAARWPSERDVPDFFGTPGSQQVLMPLPFPMRLAWDTDTVVRRVSCHRLVQEPLRRIWQNTLDRYGLDEIRRLRLDLFGGCLNVRKKRGGTGWSMHAWGIAWDVDPDRNALKMGRDEATLDGPEYDAFWDIVYAEGAIGLGRERDYDWMHFQFARLG